MPMRKDYSDVCVKQIVETKGGKKKWREEIISKIKLKLFYDRLWEASGNSLDAELRENYVKLFAAGRNALSPMQGNTKES